MKNQSTSLCQSCGLEMIAPGIQGTNADGSENPDYCRFCFREGKFLEPDMTKEQMIEKNASVVSQKSNINMAQAKSMAKLFIPKLKRWKELKQEKYAPVDTEDLPLE